MVYGVDYTGQFLDKVDKFNKYVNQKVVLLPLPEGSDYIILYKLCIWTF